MLKKAQQIEQKAELQRHLYRYTGTTFQYFPDEFQIVNIDAIIKLIALKNYKPNLYLSL